MIDIGLVIKEGDCEAKFESTKCTVGEINCAVANIEIMKLNLINRLIKLTDFKNAEA